MQLCPKSGILSRGQSTPSHYITLNSQKCIILFFKITNIIEIKTFKLKPQKPKVFLWKTYGTQVEQKQAAKALHKQVRKQNHTLEMQYNTFI